MIGGVPNGIGHGNNGTPRLLERSILDTDTNPGLRPRVIPRNRGLRPPESGYNLGNHIPGLRPDVITAIQHPGAALRIIDGGKEPCSVGLGTLM